MSYRKLGVDNKHRRALLANLTKELIKNGKIETTLARAKEVRKFADKMITCGKKGDLMARRRALSFMHNDKEVTKKLFSEVALNYTDRNGGYTRIIKLKERRGDNALMVILELV